MHDTIRRSSPANERDIEEFLERTGQVVECVFTHALVTSEDFAMSLLHKGTCGACGAAI